MRWRMSDDWVEIDVEEIRRTEQAILVRDADDKEVWLPVSQAGILEESFATGLLKLSIPVWLATEKGLI